MDFASRITGVEEELVRLKAQLDNPIGSEREIAIRNQIVATQNTLTELYKLCALQSQQAAASAITYGTEYFQVNALISACKTCKGYRASMYKCAQQCHAYYFLGDRNKTIFFEEGSDNLSVCLLFSTRDRAEEFQNKLIDFSMNHHRFWSKLTMKEDIDIVTMESEPVRVMCNHYNPSENNDSPDISLNDILSDSISVISISHDMSNCLQALESFTSVASLDSKWYKCHLVSAKNKNHSNDPDNVIYASWNFHQLFDGLNTVNGIGVTVRYVDTVGPKEVETINGKYETRYEIGVIVEFRNKDIAFIFERLLKDGTIKINDTSYSSFLYARNPEHMKEFLEIKYREAMASYNVASVNGII